MGKLIIMRHSLRFDGPLPTSNYTRNNNCDISDNGVTFAQQRGSFMLENLKEPINIIYTSPFKRCIQTSEIMQQCHYDKYKTKPEIIVNYLLSEGQNKYPPSFEKEFVDELASHGITYPENIFNINTRARQSINSIKDLLRNGKNVLVVTHGIIYNHMLSSMYSNYEFYDAMSSDEYIPRCCDISISLFEKEKFSVLYTNIESLKTC